MSLSKIFLECLPRSVPEYIELNYIEGDLIAICTWEDEVKRIKFNYVKSFRSTLEGLALKIQMDKFFSIDCFIYALERSELYLWLEDQSYDMVGNLGLDKFLLISCDDITEIIYGGKIEVLI